MNITVTEKQFDDGWCDLYMDIYPGINELLIELKQNYNMLALTNTNCIHEKIWRVKYADALIHFEKIFSSHEMKCRKPEAEAYKTVTDYLLLDPSEIIFLDDNEVNIEGARNMGMETILVRSTDQMKRDLALLLGENI